MNGAELYPEASRSLDSLRETRLLALLRDMIDGGGKVKEAKALGVNCRTVSKAARSGTLTERLADALERVEALEKRLAELEEELRGGLEALVGEVKALREEHARAMRHVERRLVRLESAGNGSETSSQVSVEPQQSRRRYVPPRTYPQLVTLEAEDGEGRVYGDAAPVIVEWRKAKAEYLKAAKTGTVLDREEAKMRMLHMEVAIIEKHELTLPPASFPWNWESRRQQVRRRERSLGSAEVDRNRSLLRLWLRRVLTVGLWRN